MGEPSSKRNWARRPSLTTARMISVALAILCLLAGWELYLVTGGLYWFLGLFLLSIWVLLKGGPFAVRTLELAGLFGRVRLDGDRLDAGRGTSETRLDEPFSLAIQFNQTTVSHTFRLRDVGVGGSRAERTETKAVSVLLATIAQDDRSFQLVADDARPPPFLAFDLKGLSYHRTPVAKPGGSVVRMHPDDLIAVLRSVHGAKGCSVTAPPDTPETSGDPRHLFWPTWKSVAGFLVLLGVGIWLAVWTLEHAPAPGPQTIGSESTGEAEDDDDDEADAKDHRAEALVGKRVFLYGSDGVKIYGRVTKTEVLERPVDYRIPPRATLTIEIDALKDVMFEPLPEGKTVPFGPEGELVGVGSEIQVDYDQATEVPPGDDD